MFLFPMYVISAVVTGGSSSYFNILYLSHIKSVLLQKRWVSRAVMLACLALKMARWEKWMMCNLVCIGFKIPRAFLRYMWMVIV